MEDYASAAARHWDSSRFLANADRVQEAAYLAGYVAECSYKAFLQHVAPAIQTRILGHDLATLSGSALQMAVLLSPASRRYSLALASPSMPGLGKWRPEHRYERTGFLPSAEFRKTIEEAEEIGRELLVGMVLDGVITEVPL